ncbi:hypothetical protein [Janibacter cremeus]|uniref:Outer membrane biosynthesis protein TonB n=1 Tax=Janibacter cremeus TaxID=1285192 RepID=A0A852VU01_9MICO|nr:hypothetical protein [Janibacter cremeus]NYF97295.1 outer membrane biosynthesis protein TonB [Janibacter cremeus]
MISSRYVGRHGSAGRRRVSVPSVDASRLTRTAVKSVAGVGIVLGSGAFVIAPSSAIGDVEPSVLGAEQSNSAADLLAGRDAAEGPEVSTVSRSAQRSAPAAITAPDKASEQADTGDLEVEPVAKPKPKPETQEETEEAGAEGTGTEGTGTEDTESTQPSAGEQSTPEPQTSQPTESESQESATPEPSSGVQTGGYASQAAAIGLGPNASAVYSAVRNQFPDITNIGGYRAGDPGDHGSGRAADIMVSGARGDQVAAWLQQNAGSLNIKYVIWKQRIWRPGSSWSYMEDRGSATANHYDHVHVSVH